MAAHSTELYELQERIERLAPEDQMYLAERILSQVRRLHFTDREALDREAAEMAADPEMQRVLRGGDLPYGNGYHSAR